MSRRPGLFRALAGRIIADQTQSIFTEDTMEPARFSRVTNLNVMRMYMLFRNNKGLKRTPHKTIEYYTEKSSVLSKRIYLTSPQQPAKSTIDQVE